MGLPHAAGSKMLWTRFVKLPPTKATVAIQQGALKADQWIFIAGVYTGKELRVYVSHDGLTSPDFRRDPRFPDYTRKVLRSPIANPGTGDFTIGYFGPGAGVHFKHPGTFDDVHIFSRGLSEDELLRVAQRGAE